MIANITPKKLSLQEALQSARETRCLEIGRHQLEKVPAIFKSQFGNKPAILVADPTTFSVAGKKVFDSFRHAGHPALEPFIFDDPKLYAEHSFVELLEKNLKTHDAIPVAVGSGSINDITKLAAYRCGRQYLCVATAASMDGYTAFGASITFNGSKQTFTCPAPQAVVADLDVICGAPPEMNASGYTDLLAKNTAGACWILADTLDVEPIDSTAWNIVQGGLRDALATPAGVRTGDFKTISNLVEGLMLGGFAMQWAKSSRPASGAEHQFSHLWDMQHHTHNGVAPSHGFKVGIGTLAVAELFERLLKNDFTTLDIERAIARWPEEKALNRRIASLLEVPELSEKAIEESHAKYVSGNALREHLEKIRKLWPEIQKRIRQHLISASELKQKLADAGAPVEPEQIGISRERLQASFEQAWFIRRRYTVLDFAARTGFLAQ